MGLGSGANVLVGGIATVGLSDETVVSGIGVLVLETAVLGTEASGTVVEFVQPANTNKPNKPINPTSLRPIIKSLHSQNCNRISKKVITMPSTLYSNG